MAFDCPGCGRVLEQQLLLACPACGRDLVDPGHTTIAFGGGTTVVAPGPPGDGDEPAPPRLGALRVVRPLGGGGMGKVYEAVDEASGRRVAVKVLARDLAGSPEALERFRQEGRLASRIAHPRCVFVLGADASAGHPCIVMELMPGRTLSDLVKERGPLEARDAVAKALDALDGLQAAHRVGVLHRDVKPSNCFLEADGRVKVGDFGLARPLLDDAHLTATGAFLGTPLFASPEQARGDELDVRTDVYSLAATLYFLLAGRAPIEARGAAVLARIASEEPTPLGQLRPDLPAPLVEAVHRGLARDRAARFQDLEQLRAALLPLIEPEPPAAPMARLAAHLVDSVVVLGPAEAIIWTLAADDPARALATRVAGELLLGGAYFGLLEGLRGATPGKWLLGLRVRGPAGGGPPGALRGLLRWLVFFGLVLLPQDVASGLADHEAVWPVLAGLAGLAAACSTLRRREGGRMLHDLLSGTRVVEPPPPAAAPVAGPPGGELVVPAPHLPAALGPYRVLGALSEEGLLAEDAALGRQVTLRLRPEGDGPLPAARRDLARPTRERWLAEGALEDGRRWDALQRPAGVPLPALVAARGPLGWPALRPVLAGLVAELEAARADGTLPATLSADQVWVGPGGVVLADAAQAGQPAKGPLELVYDVALLGLTGRRRAADDPRLARRGGPPGPLPRLPGLGCLALSLGATAALAARAAGLPVWLAALAGWASPLLLLGLRLAARLRELRRPLLGVAPLHATALLDRLPGGPGEPATLAELAAELAATAGRPVVVDRARRGRQLVLAAGLLLVPAFLALAVVVPALHASEVRRLTARVGLQRLFVHQGRPPELARDVARLESLLRSLGPLTGLLDVALQEEAAAMVEGGRASLEGHPDRPLPRSVLAGLQAGLDTLWPAWVSALAAAWPLGALLGAGVAVGALTRGGLALRLAGIGVVDVHGGEATRLRCAARTLVVWAAPVGGLVAGLLLEATDLLPSLPPPLRPATPVLPGAAAMVVVAALAYRAPGGSLLERLTGTRLVPR